MSSLVMYSNGLEWDLAKKQMVINLSAMLLLILKSVLILRILKRPKYIKLEN